MSLLGKLSEKGVIVTGGGRGIGRAICQLFAEEGASVAVLDINKNGKRQGKLSEKGVIVTGGGRGIGRAICQLFAEEGASVAVLDINKNGIEETLLQMTVHQNSKHCAIEADVTSLEQVEQSFIKAEKILGKKITILVNDAAIVRQAYVDEISEKDFDDVITTNVKGTFLMTKLFLSFLPECINDNGEVRGVIVNLSSIVGKCGIAQFAPYVSSKSALIGLTKSIALEYPKHKVRCNALLPGATLTPISEEVTKDIIEDIISVVPMGRLAKPEEIAKGCLFLASDDSSFVNGACLEVSGGFGL